MPNNKIIADTNIQGDLNVTGDLYADADTYITGQVNCCGVYSSDEIALLASEGDARLQYNPTLHCLEFVIS